LGEYRQAEIVGDPAIEQLDEILRVVPIEIGERDRPAAEARQVLGRGITDTEISFDSAIVDDRNGRPRARRDLAPGRISERRSKAARKTATRSSASASAG
jgi:hypothetical protein